MNNTLQHRSRKLSYLLRHDPEDLKMDKNGYVLVTELLKKLNISFQDLEEIISNNDKKRFAFSDSKDMVRASQGHSIKVDVQLKNERPPKLLYHGTSPYNYGLITKSGGLDKMKRLHVHLTDDIMVASSVGIRYSKMNKPIILEIDSDAMFADGYKFYLSENGVWLTDNVPLKYINKRF
jgi:putative RNA 2'-phosphotransferase